MKNYNNDFYKETKKKFAETLTLILNNWDSKKKIIYVFVRKYYIRPGLNISFVYKYKCYFPC